MRPTPVIRDLVLIGGGHSHVEVLKAFAMRPVPGVRVTLISRDTASPYSGMLPGVVAGHYQPAAANIDLVRLARCCQARFIRAEVTGLELSARRVALAGRAPLAYDILSLNTGSTPDPAASIDPQAHVVAAKPIDAFLGHWDALRQRVSAAGAVLRVVVVGGGAAGVELALAVAWRLRHDGQQAEVRLVGAAPDIVPSHGARARRMLRRRLQAAGVQVHCSVRVASCVPGAVVGADGQRFAADEVIWATSAAAPPWLRTSGLAVDRAGFVRVQASLRSESHDEVFAAGDCARFAPRSLPKSGVYAVRMGPALARNLRAALLGTRLAPFRAQRDCLSLISTGGRTAVASRGRFALAGHWVWRWKDRIDRAFMRRYSALQNLPDPVMMPSGDVPAVLARELPPPSHVDGIRCSGCAAKLGPASLDAALSRLTRTGEAKADHQARDDAAILCVPDGEVLALSVDMFRQFVDDPFVFGAIAANHALNDAYAMHARPLGVLAIAMVPVWAEAKRSEELFQMLAGADSVCAAADIRILGGHTAEGAELSLGFAVTAAAPSGQLLTKRGLQPGDQLLLTKPLGTGVLLAAAMRAAVAGADVAAALACMQRSNRTASEILAAHGATALTDVTGFGLAGHLLEMLAENTVAARLVMARLPALPGALAALAAGWRSSLHADNAANAASRCAGLAQAPSDALVFDPQTAGGLLGGVPARQAAACLAALRQSGYPDASIVGEIMPRPAGAHGSQLQLVR